MAMNTMVGTWKNGIDNHVGHDTFTVNHNH